MPLPVLLLGTGKVGSALLSLLRQRQLPLALHAVANSRRMLLSDQPLAPDAVRRELRKRGQGTCLHRLVGDFSTRFANGLVIDLTASPEVAASHTDWLASGLQLATANKWAAAGKDGAVLQRWAAQGRYAMATTVGAGLPLLNTLRELHSAGERIARVEGILSGTLSYLFQRHAQGERLSRCLLDALENGLTEPDPRDDLSGLDVARKLVILGQAAGFDTDLANVDVSSLVPRAWLGRSVSQCLQDTAALDAHVSKQSGLPPSPEAVLVPVASLTPEAASVGLRWVTPDHPLARCRPGDNMVEIQSSSYQALPLLIQGPGAGAEVTASRLLGELHLAVEAGSVLA
jgi:homoserine dehydrogenase